MAVSPSILPIHRTTIFFGLAIYFCLIFPCKTQAEDLIIAAVTVNQQPKGDFFVILWKNGDFLVESQDLEAMGISPISRDPIVRDGQPYVSLKSLENLEYEFNEATLTIEINADPSLLGQTTLDLSPEERRGVYYPRDNSIFLNYAVDVITSSDDPDLENYTLTNELGLRIDDFLLLADTIYRNAPEDSNFIRLNTRVIHDDRNTLRRAIVGDFFASSGALGSQVNLGGLSISKIYDINPYFIDYPMFDFTGQLDLPSEVDIYLGGSKIRSEKLAPGMFNLENLYGSSGEQTVEIVIRDAFGREKIIRHPFYFTDNLLRRGLHEYSYNLGWIRTDFGQSSNEYNDLAASAYHQYGFRDFFNLGWRGEGNHDLINIGIVSTMRFGHLGLLRLEGSVSRQNGSDGGAGLLQYEYLSRTFRARIGLQNYSSQYRTLANLTVEDPQIRKRAILFALGYSIPKLGSTTFDYNLTQLYNREDRETISLSWSKRIWKRTYLNTTIRKVREDSTDHEIFISLNHYFGEDYSLAVGYRHDRDEGVQSLEMRKQISVGEGTGWELRAEHADRNLSEDYLLEANVQHNAQHAIVRGTVSQGRQNSLTNERLRASVSGSIVHLGGNTAFSRPVDDSYGLIKVGEQENVLVSVNGQEIGRTDSQGRAILPNLNSYYENQISFNDKDIPIEYLMPQVRLTASPPLRSGSCINFPLRKYQAFTGLISLKTPQGITPLENANLTLVTPNGPFSFWTTKTGEFYLDSHQAEFDMMAYQGCADVVEFPDKAITPGTYPLTIRTEALSFETELAIPDLPEVYVDMGNVLLYPPSNKLDGQELSTEESANAQQSEEKLPGAVKKSQTMVSPVDETGSTTGLPDKKSEFVVHFPLDSSNPLPSAEPVLAQTLQYLEEFPDLPIEIEGHASRQGSDAYNQRLGYQRAEAFKDYLLQNGIDEQRILRIVSYGERRPLCEDWTKECHYRNRRAVLLVVMPPEN